MIESLVCPSCARTHGRIHASGCPRDIEDPPAEYVAGWDAAHFAFGDLARWAKEDERKVVITALRMFADTMEKQS